MSNRSDLIERLRTAHQFPGPYTFKVIGENHPDLESTVRETLAEVTVTDIQPRLSKNANHVSLTVKVQAQTPESLLDSYDALAALEHVKYVL